MSSILAKRALGRSGAMVSVVGLGTVKFGRTGGLRYPATIPTDDEARALLAEAARLGVNLIDTAPAYGQAEERLGELLSGGKWFVVTKAGESFDGERSSFDFSYAAIAESVARSVERLGAVHCVLLHSDGRAELTEDGFEGGARALVHAKQRGEIGLVGASVKSEIGARLAISWADVLMLEFEEGDSRMEAVAAECERRGVGILAKKALGSGHVGAGGPGAIRAAMTRVLGIPAVASVVVGTTSLSHLRENCEATA